MKRLLFILLLIVGFAFVFHPKANAVTCSSVFGATCYDTTFCSSISKCFVNATCTGAATGFACCTDTTHPANCGSCGYTSSCSGGACNSPREPSCANCQYGCSNPTCSGGTGCYGCGGTYEPCCLPGHTCYGGACNTLSNTCEPLVPTDTPTPSPTPVPCGCSLIPTPTDCTTRPGCYSGQCFPVCNYSGCPNIASWACTSEDPSCTTDCNNANAWSGWYCNIGGTETRYCSLNGCTQIAQARKPCAGNGTTPTPAPGCTPSCGDTTLQCSGATYGDGCGGICTGSGVCTGTIQARAMQVTSADTSCTAVRASAVGIGGTVHQFTPSSASQPAPQTQSGTSYSVFNNVVSGSYTMNSQAPAQYVPARVCWSDAASATSGEGLSQTLASGDTITWDLGYTLGTAWAQAQGGDVYASGTLKSFVPAGATPRAFVADGGGGYPGVAQYGQTYTFDSSNLTKGELWVSPPSNWLVNDTAATTDFYQLMYRRFGGAPATVDYVGPVSPITQPAYKADMSAPYYVTGDMTTTGDWNIADGKKLIFIINGNLTIAGKINLVGSGFAAFIVNGNITVAPSVGVPVGSSSAAVEGIYITSAAGTFSTGDSSVAGTQRFVGKGVFIAGSFLLQRDLGSASNTTTASELFIYNPQLLLTMPDAMKQISVTWQEVAP